MKFNEAIDSMTFYADQELPIDDSSAVSNKMKKWVKILKGGDPLAITYAVNRVPRIEVEPMIKKLLSNKYKNLDGTKVAISKLKWRRGF